MAAPIRLTVPGTLHYRPLAVRVVAEAARLVSRSAQRDPEDPLSHDVRDPFDTAVVSAFMEIFNNVAIHAYASELPGEPVPSGRTQGGAGSIEIALTPTADQLIIELKDTGKPFDIAAVTPLPSELDPEALPEGGMGIHIAKTMLDEMTYEPGPPNLWRLCKRLSKTRAAMGS